jgi:hypothetical protein
MINQSLINILYNITRNFKISLCNKVFKDYSKIQYHPIKTKMSSINYSTQTKREKVGTMCRAADAYFGQRDPRISHFNDIDTKKNAFQGRRITYLYLALKQKAPPESLQVL